MANIKLGGLAQDVRGSLNGTVFSRNRGGAYVRTKVSPVQPVSEFSARARAAFSAIAVAWSGTLDAGERVLWEAYAAAHPYVNVFGDAITLSGIAMFQAINRMELQLGHALISDPTAIVPTSPITPGASAVVTETDSAIDEITAIVAGNLAVGENLYIFATLPLAPALTPQKTDYRLLNIDSGQQPVILTDLVALYNARFNTPYAPVGHKISFSVRVVDPDTGSQGSPIITTVAIAAAA